MHPLPFPARRDDARITQVGEVARDFGLALAEDFNEITDADLAAVHEVEQAQTGAVREGGEEQRQVEGFWGTLHVLIIYGLTDMSRGE